jgi:uncharacterized membrane protein
MAGRASVQPGDDTALDIQIGILLRVGVYSSAAVVLLGGILYLVQHGSETPNYSQFHGVPDSLNTVSGIAAGALHGSALAIIQFGLLMLIATPVARVVFSVFAFLYERDYLYVVISAIVLAVLAYSLIAH